MLLASERKARLKARRARHVKNANGKATSLFKIVYVIDPHYNILDRKLKQRLARKTDANGRVIKGAITGGIIGGIIGGGM